MTGVNKINEYLIADNRYLPKAAFLLPSIAIKERRNLEFKAQMVQGKINDDLRNILSIVGRPG